jgi:quercetin dioxygenase-like cupin family protein
MALLHRLALVGAATLALIAVTACGGDADDEEPPPGAIELLSTTVTVLDQPIIYPGTGPAEIGSTLLTLQPGEETGWHHHEAPLYAYILEGAITVDYGIEGTRTYEAGEALMEAIGTVHNGRNLGDEQVRILVVNLGAEGYANSVIDE